MPEPELASAPRPRVITGVFTLLRLVPVLSWSVSATLLGLAAAIGTLGWRPSFAWDALLVLVGTVSFQGLVAHGVNDLEDWRSGTDALSAGMLSGGSRVIPRGLLSRRQVALCAWVAAIVGLAAAAALFVLHGPAVIVVAAIAVWSAVSYTHPLLRLSYRPFVGEILAGWPAVVTIIAGAAVVLTGQAGPGVWAAAAVQATMSVAWVMQHHLPDVPADLRANPPKVTTPALAARLWGPAAARLVPAGYYLFGALGAGVLGVVLHPVFYGSVVIGLLGAREALLTDASSVPDVTRREFNMIALTGANAALLIMAFLYGGLAVAG